MAGRLLARAGRDRGRGGMGRDARRLPRGPEGDRADRERSADRPLRAIPHGDGQTILREILLVADHNAHHLGEFAILRQVMGTWPAGRE